MTIFLFSFCIRTYASWINRYVPRMRQRICKSSPAKGRVVKFRKMVMAGIIPYYLSLSRERERVRDRERINNYLLFGLRSKRQTTNASHYFSSLRNFLKDDGRRTEDGEYHRETGTAFVGFPTTLFLGSSEAYRSK
jgi:hypothetical protein